MAINYIICRAEPNPIPDISRLNKRQRAQERADVGMDEMDPFAPKRGFLASGEDAICIFQIHFGTGAAFINAQLEPTGGGSYTLFVHRSNFLKMARQYEETSKPTHCEGQADAGVALDPLRVAWVDWGPPVSRWFNANATSNRWITTSAGQRCVMIHVGAYGSPITILDFNLLNIRKMKGKFEREKAKRKEKLQELWSKAMAQRQSPLAREMAINMADSEDRPLSPSKIGVLLSSDIHMTDMDVGEDDDHESWITMDDDANIFAGQVASDADSDDSMPGLQSVDNSDDDCFPPSAYTTDPQDYRYPGLALCRAVEASSRLSPGTFAEEVEGRLPYIEYISERDYDYDGAFLDEERMLGITVRFVHAP